MMNTVATSRRLSLLVLLAGVHSLVYGAAAHAGEPISASVVRLIAPVQGVDDTALRSIADAVASHLADLNVRTELTLRAVLPDSREERDRAAADELSDPHTMGVLWCMPEAGRYRVFIYLNPAAGDDVPTMRGVEIAGAEGTGETLAVILRASVSSLLERQHGSSEPSKDSPTPAPPVETKPDSPVPRAVAKTTVPSPPSPGNSNRLILEAAYSVSFPTLHKGPLHGAYLAAGVQVFNFVRIHLSYCITSPMTVEDEAVTVRVRRHPVGIGLALFLRHRRVEPRLRLSLLIDYAGTALTVKDESFKSVAPAGQMQISLHPQVEIGIFVYKSLQVFAGLGLEAFVVRPKYTVDIQEETRTVFDPLPVQPTAAVGLSVGFF